MLLSEHLTNISGKEITEKDVEELASRVPHFSIKIYYGVKYLKLKYVKERIIVYKKDIIFFIIIQSYFLSFFN